MITFGAFVLVYPRPGLVIVADVIVPSAAIFAVAVAVVPIPTPIAFGAENLISVVVPVYPAPALVTVMFEIDPAASTVTLKSAARGSLCSTIKASNSNVLTLRS